MDWHEEMYRLAATVRDDLNRIYHHGHESVEANRAYFAVIRALCRHTANTNTANDGEKSCDDCGHVITPART